jgi:mono/diheme cytochrome c family protein
MLGARQGRGGHAFALLFALGSVLCGAISGCEKKAAPDRAQGKNLFESTCARCHGPEGNGGLPLFDGGPSPRNFHDHTFHASHTDEQIKLTIVNGKGIGMPPFGTTFTDVQLDALVAHVRSFDPEKSGK